MPMLMTLRMRLPVWPFHAPLRTRSEKSAILSSTAWTCGTTFSPSTTIDVASRRAQRHVQDGPVFRDVDLLAPEHGVDARPQAGLLGQLQQQLERLVGDAILRVVEVEARRLGGQRARRASGRRRRASGDAAPGPSREWASRAFQAGRAVSGAVPCVMARFRSLLSASFVSGPVCRAEVAAPVVPPTGEIRPRNALALSPARHPGGSSFSFLTLPPPSTTSSGSRAAIRRATTSATCAPFLLAPLLQAALPDVILVGALPVGQVAQLHRLDDAVDDQGASRDRCPGPGRASCPPL